jgi:hypothetical protein
MGYVEVGAEEAIFYLSLHKEFCPYFPHLLSDFFEIRFKRSAHNFAEHFASFVKFGLG